MNYEKRLERALRQCVEVLKGWHGEDMFDIYYNHSPEMKLTREALSDERDGCVAGCPECIWGGKFPAKDCCEGYEPPGGNK